MSANTTHPRELPCDTWTGWPEGFHWPNPVTFASLTLFASYRLQKMCPFEFHIVLLVLTSWMLFHTDPKLLILGLKSQLGCMFNGKDQTSILQS